MERDARTLASQVAGLQSLSVELQTQIAGATSEAAVEAWAHSEGKLVREDEKLVVPIPPPGAATPLPATATPFPAPPSAWLVWRELVFGN